MATNANWTIVFEDKLIIKQSGDATGNNTCGDAAFTTVWEFDQLDPYVSGSGN